MKTAATSAVDKAHLPGEPGVWMFVLLDMLVFGLFFCTFLYYRGADVALFNSSQTALNQNLGALNTLFLLTSSWFVVMAVNTARRNMAALVPLFFAPALACGLAFCIVKIIEYNELISRGITLVTNDFYMYYFVFTGIHLLHALLGIGVLVFLLRKAYRLRRQGCSAGDLVSYETGATFWHMVDLLWIVLFPLLYLLK